MNDEFPIQQDVTVTPGDAEGKYLLDWVVHEYQGFEIYPITKEMDELFTLLYLADDRRWPTNPVTGNPIFQKPIKDKDALKVGMQVLVKGLLDYEWLRAEIKQSETWALYADTGGCIGTLEFGGDDRGCWVCTGLINKKCLELDLPTCIRGETDDARDD